MLSISSTAACANNQVPSVVGRRTSVDGCTIALGILLISSLKHGKLDGSSSGFLDALSK